MRDFPEPSWFPQTTTMEASTSSRPAEVMPINNYPTKLSRRDRAKIARRFNAGNPVRAVRVPEGRWTLCPSTPASNRPFGTGTPIAPSPGVETPGYAQWGCDWKWRANTRGAERALDCCEHRSSGRQRSALRPAPLLRRGSRAAMLAAVPKPAATGVLLCAFLLLLLGWSGVAGIKPVPPRPQPAAPPSVRLPLARATLTRQSSVLTVGSSPSSAMRTIS